MTRLLTDSSWSLLATVMSRTSSVMAAVVCVRWLGDESYGVLSFVQATSLLAGASIGAGFGAIAAPEIAALRSQSPVRAAERSRSLVRATCLVATIGSLVPLLAAPWIAEQFLGDRELANHLRLAALLTPLTALGFCHAGVLSGYSAFRCLATANCGAAFVSTLLVAVGASMLGSLGAVIGLIAGAAIGCLVTRLAIQRIESPVVGKAKADFESRLSTWRVLLSASPTLLLFALPAPIDWLGYVVLARQPEGLTEVGIYNATNQFGMLLRFVPIAFGLAMTPQLALARVEGASLSLLRSTRNVIFFTAFGSMALACLGVMCSRTVLLVYGEDYISRWSVYSALLAAGAALAVQLVAERALIALARTRTACLLAMVRSVLFVASLPLVANSGADGLATLRAIVSLVHALMAVLSLQLALKGLPCSSETEDRLATPFRRAA